MTAATPNVVRFPPRQSAVISISRADSAWLVMAGAHGWLHGDRAGADAAADWLSKNRGLPVREAAA
jgi:hypothetical protein